MATKLKLFLMSALASVAIFTSAYAKTPPKNPVEIAMDSVISSICPTTNLLQCPTLDFTTAFGIVFFTFLIGLNLVQQFRSVEGSVKTALTGIAAFVGLATAFYVWNQKIPFIAFISPFALFIVAAMLASVLIQFLFAMREGQATTSHKFLMAGLGMVIAALAMSYFNSQNSGWWYLLGFFGFLLLIIGAVLLASGYRGGFGGGGGPAAPIGLANVVRPPAPVHPTVPAGRPIIPPPTVHPTPPPSPKYNPRPPAHIVFPIPRTIPRPPVPPPTRLKDIFIDLSPHFLQIKNQGGSSACAAFASGSIFEYILNRISGAVSYKNALSELFHWYNIRTDKNGNSGTYPHEIAPMMSSIGVCSESIWPWGPVDAADIPTKFREKPPENAYMDASTKRIASAHNLNLADPDSWVLQLEKGHPIYASIEVDAAFENVGRLRRSWYGARGGGVLGGHGVVIVGFTTNYQDPEDRTKIRAAFKIRNSWGRGWGENGYIWIPRELLVTMLASQPQVFDGWKKRSQLHKFRVDGRVVYDSPQHKINYKETGLQIHNDTNILSPCSKHPVVVGIMAQVENKLIRLKEIEVSDRLGRFSLEFEYNPAYFQKLVLLPEMFRQLGGINFHQLPPGIVVYARNTAPNDENLYFHIVNFRHSMAGRGGEGIEHKDNPCYAMLHHMEVSGIPIQFSEKHSRESNVVIPVFGRSAVSEEE